MAKKANAKKNPKMEKCDFPLKTKQEVAEFCRKHKNVKYDRSSDSLILSHQFKERQDAELFVGLALWLANHLWHHPEVKMGWNSVTLSIRTHDSGGITKKDFEYASALEKILDIKSSQSK